MPTTDGDDKHQEHFLIELDNSRKAVRIIAVFFSIVICGLLLVMLAKYIF